MSTPKTELGGREASTVHSRAEGRNAPARNFALLPCSFTCSSQNISSDRQSFPFLRLLLLGNDANGWLSVRLESCKHSRKQIITKIQSRRPRFTGAPGTGPGSAGGVRRMERTKGLPALLCPTCRCASFRCPCEHKRSLVDKGKNG